MMYDAVVVGGGIGGLTSAAILAKEGKKVLLLEQFARVGGYATAWKREGITVEGVLHEIDDIGVGSQKANLLRRLGIYDKLEFVAPKEFHRVIADGIDMTVPHGYENIKKFFADNFPHEKEGLDIFFSGIDAIYDEVTELSSIKGIGVAKLLLFPLFFKSLIKYDKKSYGEFLDECIKDERLKLLISANLGYYTDNPYNLGLLFFAMAQGSYYRGGGYFVKGGSQLFSDAFADSIRQNGGEIITRAEAVKIETRGGKATGVVYRQTGAQKIPDKRAVAKVVINNASPSWAINALDDKDSVPQKKYTDFTKSQISPSCFGIYALIKGERAPNNRPYSTHVFTPYSGLGDVSHGIYAPFEKRPFAIADYGAIDSGLSNGKDLRLVAIFATDRYDDWANLDEVIYEERKKEVAETLLKRAAEIYPDILESIHSYEAATPITMERYTKNPKGAIYGFMQTSTQSGRYRKKFASILPNILNASAWGEIGGGYSGAMYGGEFAAKKALKLLGETK